MASSLDRRRCARVAQRLEVESPTFENEGALEHTAIYYDAVGIELAGKGRSMVPDCLEKSTGVKFKIEGVIE